MNKKLYILLGVSLALNFALGGYITGKSTNPVPPQRPNFAEMMHKGKGPQLFKKAFAQDINEMKMAHKAVAEAFKTGDEAKIREALKNASEVRRKMDEKIQNKMVEDFMKMNDEEKAEFIKHFDRKEMKHARRSNDFNGQGPKREGRPPEFKGQGHQDGPMPPPEMPENFGEEGALPPPPPPGME